MDKEIEKFIDEHEDLIDGGKWAELYEELFDTFWCFEAGECDKIGKFTELLLDEGADPLAKLDYVPEHYLTGAGIETLVLPNHIKRIRQFAFANCARLTDVVIPDGVTSIAYGAFCGCSSLAQARIPDSVTEIGLSVFADCEGKNLPITICAPKGSYAESYAVQNGFAFQER